MSTQTTKLTTNSIEKTLTVTGLIGLAIVLLSIGLYSLTGTSFGQSVSGLLALDSLHVWWYISRAAGLAGYLLFWLSTVWGFAISSKIFDSFLERTFTYDFHEHLSLLSIGFVILHVIVLLLDKYEPLSWVEILVPFASAYRPFWIGIGIIGFYLSVLVTITFYLRSYISMQAFRTIHYLSVASYIVSFAHSIASGTDSGFTWVQVMYWGTFLFAIFFCVQWIFTLLLNKRSATKKIQASQA